MKITFLAFLMVSSMAFAEGENNATEEVAAMCEQAHKTGCEPCVQQHCYGHNNDESNVKNLPASKKGKTKGAAKGNQG